VNNNEVVLLGQFFGKLSSLRQLSLYFARCGLISDRGFKGLNQAWKKLDLLENLSLEFLE